MQYIFPQLGQISGSLWHLKLVLTYNGKIKEKQHFSCQIENIFYKTFRTVS